jgi:hypothetical protein
MKAAVKQFTIRGLSLDLTDTELATATTRREFFNGPG